MGDIEVMGYAGLGLLRRLSDHHGHCAVPTSMTSPWAGNSVIHAVLRPQGLGNQPNKAIAKIIEKL